MATIGIDLGTFNSAVSTMLPNGKIVLLQAAHGPTAQGTVIPSFLKFLPNGELEKYGESIVTEVSRWDRSSHCGHFGRCGRCGRCSR